MENIDSENCGMTIMYLATSLCEKYDEWKTDENFIKVADANTNKICLGLKELYPHITNRVMQSIALAYSLYFYLLVNSETNKFNDEQLQNQNDALAITKMMLANLELD